MTLENAITYFNEKDYKNALKGFKDFNRLLNKSERNIVSRGYECMIRPTFYESIGFIPQECIDSAIEIVEITIKNYLDRKEQNEI
jgi:hypothetical protein